MLPQKLTASASASISCTSQGKMEGNSPEQHMYMGRPSLKQLLFSSAGQASTYFQQSTPSFPGERMKRLKRLSELSTAIRELKEICSFSVLCSRTSDSVNGPCSKTDVAKKINIPFMFMLDNFFPCKKAGAPCGKEEGSISRHDQSLIYKKKKCLHVWGHFQVWSDPQWVPGVKKYISGWQFAWGKKAISFLKSLLPFLCEIWEQMSPEALLWLQKRERHNKFININQDI